MTVSCCIKIFWSPSSCYTGSRGWFSRATGRSRMMTERHISIPKSFASRDANKWFSRYEICCKANGWNDATKTLKLPTLLEGEALTVWLELSEEQQGCYATAKEEICTALMPMEFVSLDEFHRRKM